MTIDDLHIELTQMRTARLDLHTQLATVDGAIQAIEHIIKLMSPKPEVQLAPEGD